MSISLGANSAFGLPRRGELNGARLFGTIRHDSACLAFGGVSYGTCENARHLDLQVEAVKQLSQFLRTASGDHLQPDRGASACAGGWLWIFGQKC